MRIRKNFIRTLYMAAVINSVKGTVKKSAKSPKSFDHHWFGRFLYSLLVYRWCVLTQQVLLYL